MRKLAIFQCPTCKRYTEGHPYCKGTVDNPHPHPIKAMRTGVIRTQDFLDELKKEEKEAKDIPVLEVLERLEAKVREAT